jgi:hypothetical protein
MKYHLHCLVLSIGLALIAIPRPSSAQITFVSNGRTYTVSWASTTQQGAVGVTLGYNIPLIGTYIEGKVNGIAKRRQGSTTTGPTTFTLDGPTPPGNPSTGVAGPTDVNRYVECRSHLENAKGKVITQADKITFRYRVDAAAPYFSNDFNVNVTFSFKAGYYITATAGNPGQVATNATAWPLGNFFTVTNGASRTVGTLGLLQPNGSWSGTCRLLGGTGYIEVTLPYTQVNLSTFRTLLTNLDSLNGTNPGFADSWTRAEVVPTNLTGP